MFPVLANSPDSLYDDFFPGCLSGTINGLGNYPRDDLVKRPRSASAGSLLGGNFCGQCHRSSQDAEPLTARCYPPDSGVRAVAGLPTLYSQWPAHSSVRRGVTAASVCAESAAVIAADTLTRSGDRASAASPTQYCCDARAGGRTAAAGAGRTEPAKQSADHQ